MAMRAACRRWPCAISLSSLPWSRQFTSTRVAAIQTSSLPAESQKQVFKESTVPEADPRPDTATGAFIADRTPFMVPTYVRPPIMIIKGQGCYMWDMENRRFLDLTAGIAVNSLGHCDPEISKIIAQQSETLIHASNLYHNPWTGALSKLLIQKTVASNAMRDASQVFISNSGTEANEAAIKFARKVGHSVDPSGAKHEFVSFHNSFHGRSMGALSATPNPKYQTPFSPMVPGFRYGTFNDSSNLEALITDKTCGVIVEPIQGEGGVNVATPEFLKTLRARCDAVGALLIYDEIQCGLSRTGSFWAHAHPEINGEQTPSGSAPHPDILTTAKALGNGLPIGATIISGRTVTPHIKIGDHGTTFGGNPLASRVAHHIVERLSDTGFQENVAHKSNVFKSLLRELQTRYASKGVVSEIRGLGLILGIQLSKEYVDRADDVVSAARQRGVLVITAGKGCLRLVPPLTISEEQIEAGVKVLGECFEEVFDA